MGSFCGIARSLARFLSALQSINPIKGPKPGSHNFYRGGLLSHYNAETRRAISLLKNKIDADTVTSIWEEALLSKWDKPPVWIHGDVSAGNLLVKNGQLHAIIDFGMLGTGDPACDLSIAWTLFKNKSRETFRTSINIDDSTWARGRGWCLWKALIIASKISKSNAIEERYSMLTIKKIIDDYTSLNKSTLGK